MKKKLKELENKIIKLLNKKITVISVIWLIIFTIFICNLIPKLKKKYIYVDMNNSNGVSYSCYYDVNTRDLRCLAPIKVNQYYSE